MGGNPHRVSSKWNGVMSTPGMSFMVPFSLWRRLEWKLAPDSLKHEASVFSGGKHTLGFGGGRDRPVPSSIINLLR